MKKSVKVALTTFLLAMVASSRSQSNPVRFVVTTGTSRAGTFALESTISSYSSSPVLGISRYAPVLQLYLQQYGPSGLSFQQQKVLHNLLQGYYAAQRQQERDAYLRQLKMLLEQADETTRILNRWQRSFSKPPEKASALLYDEQQKSIDKVVRDFEKSLGYSPFESNEFRIVRKTPEGYRIYDLVERRVYYVPYHSSLEVAIITDEAGKPLFQAEYGTLVPVVYPLVEPAEANREGVREPKKASQKITDSVEFEKAYPYPSGCGGTASSASLVLLPLATARSRRRREMPLQEKSSSVE